MDDGRTKRLGEFVEWTRQHITGDEKGEAQIFLDRLMKAFSQRGLLETGGTAEYRVRKKSEDRTGVTFADYVWKPIVLIEMKKRGTDLARHFRQAFDYWVHLVPNRPAYTVLCNFDEFWIYDFNESLEDPKDILTLEELPARYGPLAFLFPTREKPKFKIDRIAVTKEAADLLADVYNNLSQRRDLSPALVQRFILQTLIAMFSEDIGLLPKYFVSELLDDCTDPPKAFDLFQGLFTAMATEQGMPGGRFKDVPYFNGGIFREPAPIELPIEDIRRLKRAAEYDWSEISPDIFGTIFQHSMDETERHKYGGHYTTPTDIMKIVKPTIVDPWRTAIESARSIKQLRQLRQRLYSFRVLDPACGSGNFLYIAYRELKRIEAELVEKIRDAAGAKDKEQPVFGFVTSKQFFGMDIVPFAVELAKVTMTLGHKLAIDELHIDEKPLPLDNLDKNIVCIDALIDWPIDGSTPPNFDPKKKRERTAWPKVDVIIGNPPFLGSKRLKPERGADYVNAVRKVYPKVPGMADYCVYWIARAQEELPESTPDDPLRGRAGLVGTQNIRNNKSREGGLDQVVKSGTIVEAVDNQPWSGEANVHVSIANWVKHAPPPVQIPGTMVEEESAFNPKKLLIPAKKKLWFKVDASLPLFEPANGGKRRSTTVTTKRGTPRKDKSYELTYRETHQINSALSDKIDVSQKAQLLCNKKPKRCFQGKIPGYDGFMLKQPEMKQIAGDSLEVVVPYLTGRELLSDFRIVRWAIDFGNRGMLEASQFKSAFAHCQARVLPAVQKSVADATKSQSDMVKARREHAERWWQFWNRRDQLSDAISSVDRYIGCSRVTRRPVMVFLSSRICPSDLVQVFLFDDDYSFGILQSGLHFDWFRTSSRMKVETDTRYSVRNVFDTFPWPQGSQFSGPSPGQVDAVAEAGREVRRVRAEALTKMSGGLRALYRTLELPGKNPLKDAHAALDQAVLDAYGFNAKDDLLKQLLELNLTVAKRIEKDDPVVAPGIPASYRRGRDKLVTDDYVRAK